MELSMLSTRPLEAALAWSSWTPGGYRLHIIATSAEARAAAETCQLEWSVRRLVFRHFPTRAGKAGARAAKDFEL